MMRSRFDTKHIIIIIIIIIIIKARVWQMDRRNWRGIYAL